jgi:hypothetical protein
MKRLILMGHLRSVGQWVTALAVALCASSALAAEIAPSTTILVDRPLIVGLWEMPIPNKACIEYYNFREDGGFVVKSAGEWTTGEYQYDLPEINDNSLPMLTMKIKSDNLATDCSGKAVDQSNEVQRQFVRWNTDQRSIEFCETAEGQQCVLALARLLP